MKNRYYLIATLFILSCLTACTKDSSNTTTTQTTNPNNPIGLTIETAGCEEAGNYISFSYIFNIGITIGDTSFLWDFGDGTTSNVDGLNFNHAYSTPGNYTVTLKINHNITTKQITITSCPLSSTYTDSMGRLRHWVGSGYGWITEFNIQTNTSYSLDTVLAIDVMNSSFISFPFGSASYPPTSLQLISVDTVNKLLSFQSCLQASIKAYYYYQADSIVYTNNWSIGHRNEEFTIYAVR